VLGYTATLAGLVLTAGGFLVLIAMPVVGQLSSRFQARYLIAFGWLLLAGAMFYTTRQWNTGLSFRSASILRVVQVAGLGFLFVPISLAAYVGMPPEKSNNVAGLLNFSRNIGSSIGTSMVTTLIARRAQVHQTYLANHVTPAGLNFPQAVDALTRRLNVAGLESTLAQRQAYARLYRATIAQATTLAYIDVFMILGVTSVIMFFLSFALKKNEPGGGGGAAVG